MSTDKVELHDFMKGWYIATSETKKNEIMTIVVLESTDKILETLF